ncbi:translation initiation factor IF-2-like [Canis lupus dingo]|uniref:translation initiation factor IF-2-like n=1 Tax=Canis lupus dingo TaxID=286419 RepID=UPI0020C573C6|nr:translation initiation factor IF-2-like [Canis lupus dingo]
MAEAGGGVWVRSSPAPGVGVGGRGGSRGGRGADGRGESRAERGRRHGRRRPGGAGGTRTLRLAPRPERPPPPGLPDCARVSAALRAPRAASARGLSGSPRRSRRPAAGTARDYPGREPAAPASVPGVAGAGLPAAPRMRPCFQGDARHVNDVRLHGNREVATSGERGGGAAVGRGCCGGLPGGSAAGGLRQGPPSGSRDVVLPRRPLPWEPPRPQASLRSEDGASAGPRRSAPGRAHEAKDP